MLNSLWQDLRYGTRMLRKKPGTIFVLILALALGIGANTAIFSVVDSVLLRPLPFRDADRLVKVQESNPQRGFSRLMISLGDFAEWKKQNQSFEDICVFDHFTFRVTDLAEPEEVSGNRVSTNFFDVLGVKPLVGRTFLANDDDRSQPLVVILSYKYWVSRFGSDQNISGKTITLNDKPHVIIGVLPPGFREDFESFPGRAQLWVPAQLGSAEGSARGPGGYTAIARLKPNVTRKQSGAEMIAIAQRLAQSFPQTNKGISANVYSLHEEVTGDNRQTLVMLFVAVGFVLLIACANVAALQIARGIERTREVAVRLAIGAGRGRVIRQLLTESLLLSLLGGSLGWLIARGMLAAIVSFIPPGISRMDELVLDNRALVFTIALALLSTILFGVLPAIQTTKLDLTGALNASGHISSEGRYRLRLRQTLVISQVALTMILLVGAGLMTNSLIRLHRIDPGISTRNLVVMQMSLRTANKDDRDAPNRWNSFWDSLTEQASSLPGVQAAATVVPMPLADSQFTIRIGLEPRVGAPREDVVVPYNTVGGAYFRTLGIAIKQGRVFSADDKPSSAPAIVVNESFATAYFPGQEILGQTLLLNAGRKDDEKTATIIGVVSDSRSRLNQRAQPQLYELANQFPKPSMYLIARTTVEAGSLFGAMRNMSSSLDPHQPIQLTTMDDIRESYIVGPRFYLTMIASLAGLAVVLAATGIYGVLSCTLGQRTREIGIRRALGAQDKDVRRLMIRQGMSVALIGGVIGLIAALPLTRLMRGWLYEVGTSDPITLATVVAMLTMVAWLACCVPARRAVRLDPLEAIRHE